MATANDTVQDHEVSVVAVLYTDKFVAKNSTPNECQNSNDVTVNRRTPAIYRIDLHLCLKLKKFDQGPLTGSREILAE